MKPMFFPVTGRINYGFVTIATFFDTSSAIDFISSEAPDRDLYLGTPDYDRRTFGYRPKQPDYRAEYREWCAGLTNVNPDPIPLKRRKAA